MQKRRCIIFVCLFIIAAASFARAPDTVWTRRYGGDLLDKASSVQQTADGGYIVCAITDLPDTTRAIWLIKTDANGDTIWTKIPQAGTGMSAVQTSDGGYALTGWTGGSAGRHNILLIKTDYSGNTTWIKTYGGPDTERGFSLQQTTDGGYIITGFTTSYVASRGDVWLVKTDSNGDTIWTKSYPNPGLDFAQSVQQTTDGGYIIGGTNGEDTQPPGEDLDLIKTDCDGELIWRKSFGGRYNDRGYSAQETSDGGYVILGDVTYSGVHLYKTDANGNTMWVSNCGQGHGHAVVETYDGGYVIAGRIRVDPNTDQYSLIKIDRMGNVVWTRTYAMGGEARSVLQTVDGGYIIAGEFDGDVFIVKTKPEYVYADLGVSPNMLNLKSNGGWITCYTELPDSCSVLDIDTSTVAITAINGASIVPIYRNGPTDIGDYDSDGIPDRMTKFDRQILKGVLDSLVTPPLEVELTICGELTDGLEFRGIDTIYVFQPGGPHVAEESNISRTTTLYANQPDPFCERTTIKYGLAQDSHTKLVIYDIAGNKVRTLVNDVMYAGYHSIAWDGHDNNGKRAPSGVYFLKFQSGDIASTEKLVLLR